MFDPQLDAVTMQICSLLRTGHKHLRKDRDGTYRLVHRHGDETVISAHAIGLLIAEKVIGKNLKLSRKAKKWLHMPGTAYKSIELGDLKAGEQVRVFRTSAGSPLYLCDLPFNDDDENNYPSTFTLDLYLTGTVHEHGMAFYRVIVTHEGREMGVDWIGRHWIRREGEPGVFWY